MLTSLTIHNVVLIDRLTLEGAAGLSALTGETGAGKSILLDALGLALGMRAEAGLVRHGEQQATVTACFDIPAKHPVIRLLKEKDLEAVDTLILRRTLGKDGRSKAFINDAPVSVQLLKEIGADLVEIHGQFETQGLLNAATHGVVLDSYAGTTAAAEEVRGAWRAWRQARENLERAITEIESTRLQEEYLKYTVAELKKLDPQPGEEIVLAEKRSYLLNRDKMRGAIEQAGEILESEGGIQSQLGKLHATLARLPGLPAVLETLTRLQNETDELSYQIENLKNADAGSENLEALENRYFALKECAKKHRCATDDLPRIHAELAQKLRLITHQEDTLADLNKAVATAREEYRTLAEKVSARRQKASQKLAKAVSAELPALKLDKARFTVSCITGASELEWGPDGMDAVQFIVATNPQTPAGPLHKIASGGELARFMLALKLILAATSSVPTLIFDEVDSGIGGATADAVGERLARLSQTCQVLAVTHSPQVASRARHHWVVAKAEHRNAAVITRITPLKILADRQEEIARMLSGATITAEARAAAAKLLESHAA